LKRKKVDPENKALILNALLEHISALPIKDIVTYDVNGTVQLNGEALEPSQLIRLKDGAEALRNNPTYKVIKDQIAYEAIKFGVHSSTTLDMVLFGKAALWIQQQEKSLIAKLSGFTDDLTH